MKLLAALLIAPLVAAQPWKGSRYHQAPQSSRFAAFLIRQTVNADTTLKPVNHAEFEVGPVDATTFDFCTVEGPAEDGSKTTACGTTPYSFALLGGSPGAYKIRITFKAAEHVILRGSPQSGDKTAEGDIYVRCSDKDKVWTCEQSSNFALVLH